MQNSPFLPYQWPRPPLVLIVPTHRGMARLSRPGWLWLNTKMVYPQTVTHPNTNRARRRATTLIKTNALPLSQTATYKHDNLLLSSENTLWHFYTYWWCTCVFVCRKVAAAIHYVMHAVVSSAYVEPLWLFAVPLYHFLSNTVKPFTRSSEHSSASHQNNEWWGIANFVKLVEDFKWMQKANM